jgi:hypothetical protein
LIGRPEMLPQHRLARAPKVVSVVEIASEKPFGVDAHATAQNSTGAIWPLNVWLMKAKILSHTNSQSPKLNQLGSAIRVYATVEKKARIRM